MSFLNHVAYTLRAPLWMDGRVGALNLLIPVLGERTWKAARARMDDKFFPGFRCHNTLTGRGN